METRVNAKFPLKLFHSFSQWFEPWLVARLNELFPTWVYRRVAPAEIGNFLVRVIGVSVKSGMLSLTTLHQDTHHKLPKPEELLLWHQGYFFGAEFWWLFHFASGGEVSYPSCQRMRLMRISYLVLSTQTLQLICRTVEPPTTPFECHVNKTFTYLCHFKSHVPLCPWLFLNKSI